MFCIDFSCIVLAVYDKSVDFFLTTQKIFYSVRISVMTEQRSSNVFEDHLTLHMNLVRQALK